MLWPAVVLLALSPTQAPAPTATVPPGDHPRTFVVTYSDGRTVSELLRSRGGTITQNFPHRPDAPPNEGLSLNSLQIDYFADRDVIVKVSLLYGPVYQETIRVAEVKLTDAKPVTVTALEAFGVDPIVLSLGDFAVRPLVRPTSASVSPMLDVSVELTDAELPFYKVTLLNRSTAAVLAFDFRTFLDQMPRTSGRHATRTFAPIVPAGGEHEFTMPAGTGPTPGMDRLEVQAILWSDGTVAGDPWIKRSEEAYAVGQAQQLERLLRLLQDPVVTQAKDLSSVKAAVDALPVRLDAATSVWASQVGRDRRQLVESGQQGVRASALRDIDDFAKKHSTASEPVGTWVVTAKSKYGAWLKRIRELSEALRSDR